MENKRVLQIKDINCTCSKLEEYPCFIIELILEYGDEKEIKWMSDNFIRKQIIKIVRESRGLSPRSANYWRLIFNLKKENVLCLTKSFREKQQNYLRSIRMLNKINV